MVSAKVRRASAMLAVLVALVAAAMCRASPARACSSCACGTAAPTTAGVEVPFAGRLRAALLVDGAGVADDLSAVVAAQGRAALLWAPTADVVLDAALAAGSRLRLDNDDAYPSGHALHLGDANAGARFVVFKDRRFAPRHVASLRLSTTFPTGPEVTSGGVPVASELQPGRGAVIPRVDASWLVLPDPRLQLVLGASAEAPLVALRALRPAPVVEALALGQLIVKEGVTIRLGVSGRLVGAEEEDGRTVVSGQRVSAFVLSGVMVQPDGETLIVLDVAVPAISAPLGGGLTRDRALASLSLVRDLPALALR